jgi:hypothetical protein
MVDRPVALAAAGLVIAGERGAQSSQMRLRQGAGRRGGLLRLMAARGWGGQVRACCVSMEPRVIPGDRRETRDPFLNLYREGSGMDPGSPLRSVRDDSRISGEGYETPFTIVHAHASRRLPPRGCEVNAIRGRRGAKAASQSTAACRMSMSMCRSSATGRCPSPARGSLLSSRRVLRPAGPGCLPRTTKPLRGGTSRLRSQTWVARLRSQTHSGLQGPVATNTALPPGLMMPREAPSVRAGRGGA